MFKFKDLITKDNLKTGTATTRDISSTDTLSLKDIKRAIKTLNKNIVPFNKNKRTVILPAICKKHPKAVREFVNSYKIIGIDISVVYDRQIKNYLPETS